MNLGGGVLPHRCHLRFKMRTHKYSEVTAKYRPINIPLYISEDFLSWKPQDLSQILLSAATCLLTMSTLVIIQKERAVYGSWNHLSSNYSLNLMINAPILSLARVEIHYKT